MRTLDECKAEIFRRSEIKIRERKKTRRRILAVCIPLCLCIGIGTAGFAAGGFGAKGENAAEAPESVLMGADSYRADSETVVEDSQAMGAYGTRPVGGSYLEEKPNYGYPAEIVMKEISVNGKTCFIGEDYETLKDILENLKYSPHKVCRCLPQYKIEADFGSYGIHLSEGYARCDAGQADLTDEQINTIRDIFDKLSINESTE